MAPSARNKHGSLFIALRSYFDKSGEDTRHLICGGVCASDDLWDEIEKTWQYCLNSHTPRATYMHMIEAVPLRKEFSRDKGWGDEMVFGLVNQLLSYLTTLPKHEYCHVTATVDLAAYRKLQNENYQMDSAADLCITTCTLGLFDWFLDHYHGPDREAHYYFDAGEPFEPILKAKWESELEASRRTGVDSFWSLIGHIGPAQMRCTPGLQVADMLAWATNRDLNELPLRYKELILPLRVLVPSLCITWDEEQLRRRFRPL